MLVFTDIETTGLNPDTDQILEVALVITDDHLEVQDTASWLVEHPFGRYEPSQWDEVVRQMHTKSGLLEQLTGVVGPDRNRLRHFDVQKAACKWLDDHGAVGKSPMCGSSVHFDRKFLALQMPNLDACFHYRNIDVSTLKELCKRWAPATWPSVPDSEKAHRALPDAMESIRELTFYKEMLFKNAKAPIPPLNGVSEWQTWDKVAAIPPRPRPTWPAWHRSDGLPKRAGDE